MLSVLGLPVLLLLFGLAGAVHKGPPSYLNQTPEPRNAEDVSVLFTNELSAGVFFKLERTFYLALDEWVVVLKLPNFKQYQSNVSTLIKRLDSWLKTTFNSTDSLNSETKAILTELYNLDVKLNDFVETVKRTKRSLSSKPEFHACDTSLDVQVCNNSSLWLPVFHPKAADLYSLLAVRFLRKFYRQLELSLARKYFDETGQAELPNLYPRHLDDPSFLKSRPPFSVASFPLNETAKNRSLVPSSTASPYVVVQPTTTTPTPPTTMPTPTTTTTTTTAPSRQPNPTSPKPSRLKLPALPPLLSLPTKPPRAYPQPPTPPEPTTTTTEPPPAFQNPFLPAAPEEDVAFKNPFRSRNTGPVPTDLLSFDPSLLPGVEETHIPRPIPKRPNLFQFANFTWYADKTSAFLWLNGSCYNLPSTWHALTYCPDVFRSFYANVSGVLDNTLTHVWSPPVPFSHLPPLPEQQADTFRSLWEADPMLQSMPLPGTATKDSMPEPVSQNEPRRHRHLGTIFGFWGTALAGRKMDREDLELRVKERRVQNLTLSIGDLSQAVQDLGEWSNDTVLHMRNVVEAVRDLQAKVYDLDLDGRAKRELRASVDNVLNMISDLTSAAEEFPFQEPTDSPSPAKPSLNSQILDSLLSEPGAVRNRQKRTLFGFVGSLMHDVLGVMSEDQEKDIVAKMKALKGQSDILTRLANHTASALNMSLTVLKRHELMLENLANMSAVDVKALTQKDKLLASHFRQLQASVAFVHTELTAAFAAWHQAEFDSTLSSALIQPKQLVTILQNLATQLPSGLSLPLSISSATVHYYFNSIVARPVWQEDGPLMFLHVPLVHTNRKFHLYKILPWPVRTNVSNVFMYFEPDVPYIAVSPETNTHLLLTQAQVDACSWNRELHVCHPLVEAHQQPTCSFSLLMSDQDAVRKLCRPKFISDPAPRFSGFKDGRAWAFSLPHPAALALFNTQGQRVTAQVSQLRDNGILTLPPGFTAVLQSAKTLYASSNYKSAVDGDGILLPSLPDLKAEDYFKSATDPTGERTFKDLFRSLNSEKLLEGASMADIQRLTKEAEEGASILDHVYNHPAGSVAIFTWVCIGLFTIVVLIFAIGLYKKCCGSQPKGPRASTIQIVPPSRELTTFFRRRPEVDSD